MRAHGVRERPVVGIACADALAEAAREGIDSGAQAVEPPRRYRLVDAEQIAEPTPLGDDHRLFAGQLAGNDGENVPRNERVEALAPFEPWQEILVQELTDGSQQLDRRGTVLHLRRLHQIQ